MCGMRLHRFYAHKNIVDGAGLDGKKKGDTLTYIDVGGQWARVFRFKKGDVVVLFNGNGFEYVSEIIGRGTRDGVHNLSRGDETFSLSIVDVKQGAPKPRTNITLYASLIKKSNFELVAQKAVEIGVSTIVPTLSDRTEKKDINLDRLHTIVIEAVEQSGRGDVPTIKEVTSIDDALHTAIGSTSSRSDSLIAFYDTVHSDTEGNTVKNANTDKDNIKDVHVFIGPEGGWSDRERALFKDAGIQALSLGDYILRAETAVIIAVSKWV